MSFLAPLFWLGGLAVALPVVFHLIRRTTREKTIFSSLMFLQPTPPRLTRRSRLEHLLLLALRCAAILILAAGFARPFFRQSSLNNDSAALSKRIVILVDTSASMRRGGLWDEARKRAAAILADATPADHVALFTFDRQLTPVVSFEEWDSMPPGDRVSQADSRLGAHPPGWSSTHLGNALIRAAEEVADAAGRQTPGPKRIYLISDIQEGSRLDQLQAYDWPKGVELWVEPVKAKPGVNAGLQLVAESADADRNTDPVVRVRIANSSDSRREQFQVGWSRPDGQGFVGAPLDAYVPPGQSRILSVPTPTNVAGLNRIVLRGDDEPFDNTVFVVPPEPARLNVLYLGADAAENVHQPLFFLHRALPETRRQAVKVLARPGNAPVSAEDLKAATVVVVTDPLPDDRATLVRESMLAGKTVLFAPKNTASAPTLAKLAEKDAISMEEAKLATFALLGDIDFRHALFAPFADPRYSDFTKIHFWRYRKLDPAAIPGAHIVAKFDSGDPALMEASIGKGRLLVLASGWNPDDSQFALSSKFVPFVYSLLELAGGSTAPPTQHFVGDSIPISPDPGEKFSLQPPSGPPAELPVGTTQISQTLEPGIYTLTSAQSMRRYVVNVDPSEARTAPLPVEEFERLGAPLKQGITSEARETARKALLKNSEAEGRQKLWRWLLVGTLAILLVESILAGWTARRTSTPVEAAT